MEGILYKQGEGLVKSWKKRWCFLNREEAKLYYGKDRGAGFISAIALDKALSVTRSERIKAKGVGFGFQIATSDRIWSLVALTNTERESWIKAIQRLILSSEKSTVSPSPTRPLVKSESSPILSNLELKTKEPSYPSIKVSRPRILVPSSSSHNTRNTPSGTYKNARLGVLVNAQERESKLTEHLNAEKTKPFDKKNEENGVFDLEEELDLPKKPFFENEPRSRSRGTIFFINDNNYNHQRALNTETYRLASSLPVTIPNSKFGGRFCEFFEEEEGSEGKDMKPHELAALTFQEHYLRSWGREFDVPLSNTRKIKALI
eukprot:TRINITY_DN4972_c0_g1_i1.p1 TRINITY_DN4972_c0_g1~~TRINITY_DN4972_c0_g1_i1.p1  ORF type:complete len:334 (+),score=51.39 TRINITY_DN4972_c0_g1_i1:50-1003(+)